MFCRRDQQRTTSTLRLAKKKIIQERTKKNMAGNSADRTPRYSMRNANCKHPYPLESLSELNEVVELGVEHL